MRNLESSHADITFHQYHRVRHSLEVLSLFHLLWSQTIFHVTVSCSLSSVWNVSGRSGSRRTLLRCARERAPGARSEFPESRRVYRLTTFTISSPNYRDQIKVISEGKTSSQIYLLSLKQILNGEEIKLLWELGKGSEVEWGVWDWQFSSRWLSCYCWNKEPASASLVRFQTHLKSHLKWQTDEVSRFLFLIECAQALSLDSVQQPNWMISNFIRVRDQRLSHRTAQTFPSVKCSFALESASAPQPVKQKTYVQINTGLTFKTAPCAKGTDLFRSCRIRDDIDCVPSLRSRQSSWRGASAKVSTLGPTLQPRKRLSVPLTAMWKIESFIKKDLMQCSHNVVIPLDNAFK